MKFTRLLNSRSLVIVMTLGMVLAVGMADYLTGYEMSFSIFYLLAIWFALWFAGRNFALFIGVLSVGCSIWGDLKAGAVYLNRFVPGWNSFINLAFYLLVIWLLSRIKTFQQDLEGRVQQRTSALTEEMAERERLEKENIAISERERQSIGHDLHDSLCQHLTGTAMAGQVVGEKLAAQALPEAADLETVVSLIEEGITMARNIARGLSPVEFEAHGLMDAFRELAESLSARFKVRCKFECEGEVLVDDGVTAVHLYRIVQEATSNAIRHGRAKQIRISFALIGQAIYLMVRDDGCGIPSVISNEHQGMGLRIMKQRSKMIGADFSIKPDPEGGTLVQCILPE